MEPVTPTQVARPWRATFRTVFQGLVALAAILPVVFAGLPLGPAAAGALAIAGAITRIMAIPQVEEFLQKYVSFLAAKPQS
jgi:hypothetical protein